MGQSIELTGKVKSTTDVENIHVINKTSNVFTITDKEGKFKILAKLNDTISFSSIQHVPKFVVINKLIHSARIIEVVLEEQINNLDEVTVGKVLTGNLLLDINNVQGEPPLNFFDVGIPGYKGRIKTQSERRLSEASQLAPKAGGSLGGVGGSISATALINAISGRTKMLKNRVEMEERESLMQSIKARLGRDFFASNPLDEDLRMEFFYFCSDDENFIKYCKNQTDFKIFIFLRMKYRQYLENLNESRD